jgi:hypothetical protein
MGNVHIVQRHNNKMTIYYTSCEAVILELRDTKDDSKI